MAGQGQGSALLLRIATGLVLIAVALTAVWLGGMAFTALVALAVLTMFAEWTVMFRIARPLRLAGLALLAGLAFLSTVLPTGELLVALAGGAGLAGLFARKLEPRSAFWVTAGLLYCGLPALALVWLRGTFNGVQLTLWVLACVWATDIGAYFIGRAIGGPKLAPSISPAKTWAGAVGGVAVAALAGAEALNLKSTSSGFFGHLAGPNTAQFAILSALLAVAAVLGDLFESSLKRKAGVKDSGTLLPGHGGVLDRLDGLVPAACIGALIVLAKGWAG